MKTTETMEVMVATVVVMEATVDMEAMVEEAMARTITIQRLKLRCSASWVLQQPKGLSMAHDTTTETDAIMEAAVTTITSQGMTMMNIFTTDTVTQLLLLHSLSIYSQPPEHSVLQRRPRLSLSTCFQLQQRLRQHHFPWICFRHHQLSLHYPSHSILSSLPLLGHSWESESKKIEGNARKFKLCFIFKQKKNLFEIVQIF